MLRIVVSRTFAIKLGSHFFFEIFSRITTSSYSSTIMFCKSRVTLSANLQAALLPTLLSPSFTSRNIAPICLSICFPHSLSSTIKLSGRCGLASKVISSFYCLHREMYLKYFTLRSSTLHTYTQPPFKHSRFILSKEIFLLAYSITKVLNKCAAIIIS